MDVFAPPASQPIDADYPMPVFKLYAPPYSEEMAEAARSKLLTKKHTIAEKMQLYNCSTKGNLDEFKILIQEKGYSVSEEVSKEGHFWTVLHYASHYGHLNIIKFLIEHLKDNEKSFEILNMQTVEGKTPLFCAILSCDIKPDLKKEIIKEFFDTYQMDLSLRKKTGEDLLQLAKAQNMYEFIVLKCMRED